MYTYVLPLTEWKQQAFLQFLSKQGSTERWETVSVLVKSEMSSSVSLRVHQVIHDFIRHEEGSNFSPTKTTQTSTLWAESAVVLQRDPAAF